MGREKGTMISNNKATKLPSYYTRMNVLNKGVRLGQRHPHQLSIIQHHLAPTPPLEKLCDEGVITGELLVVAKRYHRVTRYAISTFPQIACLTNLQKIDSAQYRNSLSYEKEEQAQLYCQWRQACQCLRQFQMKGVLDQLVLEERHELLPLIRQYHALKNLLIESLNALGKVFS